MEKKGNNAAEFSIVSLVTIIAIILLAGVVSGCSFKVEALYHGETPIGLDNRHATSLADKPAKRVPVKLSAVSNEGY